jgi:hypothetical protein
MHLFCQKGFVKNGWAHLSAETVVVCFRHVAMSEWCMTIVSIIEMRPAPCSNAIIYVGSGMRTWIGLRETANFPTEPVIFLCRMLLINGVQ